MLSFKETFLGFTLKAEREFFYLRMRFSHWRDSKDEVDGSENVVQNAYSRFCSN